MKSTELALLAEGLQLKQLVQLLVRLEESNFENDDEVEMKLYMDSTSARAMISRLGPGRSKHISTRFAASTEKEAMVQGCTEKNVADLNTKSLSLRRR